MFETEPLAPNAFVRPSGRQVVGALAELRRPTVKRPGNSTGWIPGGKHAKLVPAVDQLIRELFDVPVHAPRIGPGIGRDDGDAHSVDGSRSGRGDVGFGLG